MRVIRQFKCDAEQAFVLEIGDTITIEEGDAVLVVPPKSIVKLEVHVDGNTI